MLHRQSGVAFDVACGRLCQARGLGMLGSPPARLLHLLWDFYVTTYSVSSLPVVSAAERKEREASNHPVFIAKLKDSEMLKDSTSSFMLHVKGNPNPEMKL